MHGHLNVKLGKLSSNVCTEFKNVVSFLFLSRKFIK